MRHSRDSTHGRTHKVCASAADLSSLSACSVQVPLIEAQPSEIDLGNCFLYFPYSTCVELTNRSGLYARYSLQEQVGMGVYWWLRSEAPRSPLTQFMMCFSAFY